MSEVETHRAQALVEEVAATAPADRSGPMASLSSLAAAGLSASCCILPLVLVLLGLGGVWVGTLTSLAAYKPWLLTLSAGLLAFGYWRAYGRPASCAGGSCRRGGLRLTRAILWFSTLVVLASATTGWWMPLVLN